MRILATYVVALLTITSSLSAAESWTQFRGPDGQGHAEAESAPLEWGEDKNIAWKCELPGRGWSSPVVLGDQIWMTAAREQRSPDEKRAAIKDDSPVKHLELGINDTVTFHALCVDRASGEVVFDIELFKVKDPEPIHKLNSYASPTPVLEEGRLYCHFGAFGTACLDTNTAEVLWREVFPIEHYVGPGSSPVLFKDVLILTCDGADKQYVVGVNKETGKPIWKKDRPPLRSTNPDTKKSYCTPLVIEAAGRDQAIMPGSQWFISYNPLTGDEIWRVDHGRGFSLVPRPVYDGERLFLCTGFSKPQLWVVDPTGVGDVTESHVIWKETKSIPSMPSPLLVNDQLYVLSEEGIMTCFDPTNGDVIWKKRVGGNFSASPQEIAGKIYCFSREGVTTVIEPGDSLEIVAKNELDGQIMATPPVVDGNIYLRTDTALYCIAQ